MARPALILTNANPNSLSEGRNLSFLFLFQFRTTDQSFQSFDSRLLSTGIWLYHLRWGKWLLHSLHSCYFEPSQIRMYPASYHDHQNCMNSALLWSTVAWFCHANVYKRSYDIYFHRVSTSLCSPSPRMRPKPKDVSNITSLKSLKSRKIFKIFKI